MLMVMAGNRHHPPEEKDLTAQYLEGTLDTEDIELRQRFSTRAAQARHRKTQRTALLRLAREAVTGDIESLPVGRVIQVYSLYSEVEYQGQVRLCVMRKTLTALPGAPPVVGDQVRFRDTETRDEQGRPQAVIEQILPRQTILRRAGEPGTAQAQPIVANADQMLIVASLHQPEPRWGLVDRMVVAAQVAGLNPLICLNKVDLASGDDLAQAIAVLEHYQSLGLRTFRTSAVSGAGLGDLEAAFRGSITVLAGHSGVGKSSLLNALDPSLNLRTRPVSSCTGKGRHTTSWARLFHLRSGGDVVDTPGVRLFGLSGATRENLIDWFPDIQAGTAPEWRQASFQRILQSLPESPGAEP